MQNIVFVFNLLITIDYSKIKRIFYKTINVLLNNLK